VDKAPRHKPCKVRRVHRWGPDRNWKKTTSGTGAICEGQAACDFPLARPQNHNRLILSEPFERVCTVHSLAASQSPSNFADESRSPSTTRARGCGRPQYKLNIKLTCRGILRDSAGHVLEREARYVEGTEGESRGNRHRDICSIT
jgi:hypothetical protein